MKPVAFLLPLMLAWCGENLGEQNGNYEWYVKNCTDKTVTVYCSWLGDKIYSIDVGDSMCVCSYFRFKGNPTIPFDGFFDTGNDRTFSILDENGKVVKSWTSKDDNEGERQFQDEACWRKSEREDKDGKMYYTYIDWTFDILPEDLEP